MNKKEGNNFFVELYLMCLFVFSVLYFTFYVYFIVLCVLYVCMHVCACYLYKLHVFFSIYYKKGEKKAKIKLLNLCIIQLNFCFVYTLNDAKRIVILFFAKKS